MIAAAALLALASLAGPGPLDSAREAFARSDYAQAEALALSAAQPPQQGAALYLVGLARFREGHPAEALSAFEQAARAADAPAGALFHFNQGACLYELGRYAESEQQYGEAAELDPSLAAAALANAGFAALDGGSPDRARALAARARATASGPAADLVAELESHLAGPAASSEASAAAEYRGGLAAYDTGDYRAARERFLRAAELDRSDGRSRIMAGAAAFRLGALGEARSSLTQALGLGLDETDAQTAREYLDALSPGLASRGQGWEGSARAGGGYDSDPLQTGFIEQHEFASAGGQAGSAFSSADAALSFRFKPRDLLFAEVAYGFDQLAYFAPSAADRSLQQHGLAFALELSPRDDLRLGGSVGGQLAFTGLSRFRGLQASAGAAAWMAFDESAITTTRLDLAVTQKAGLIDEFSYLSGQRFDASLSQSLTLRPVTLEAGYAFRAELIGTSQQAALSERQGCMGCAAVDVIPFGYDGNTLWLSGRTAALGGHILLELSGGLEWRDYLGDEYLLITRDGVTTEQGQRQRHDDRVFGSASASLRLTRGSSLMLRYDLLVSRSNVSAGAPDPNNRNYDKHVLTLGTALTW